MINIGWWNMLYIISIFYSNNIYYNIFVITSNILLLILRNKTKHSNTMAYLKNYYFTRRNGKIIYDCDQSLFENNQFIYGYHPHGNLPLGLCGIMNTNLFQNTIILISNILFRIPFINLLLYYKGNMDSITSKNIDKYITLGNNIIICPGGVHEMLLCQPYSNKIYISTKHKGFIKKAIQYGISIVPTFCFGENNSTINQLKPLEKWVYHKCKITIPGIQTNKYYLPISNHDTITYIIGKPIHISKSYQMTTEEYIKSIELQYYQRIIDIFNKYNPQYGTINDKIVFC